MDCTSSVLRAKLFAIAVALSVTTPFGCDDSPSDLSFANTNTVMVELALMEGACGVVAVTATISAADMATIGPTNLQIENDSVSGTFDVPVGSERTISIAAVNAEDQIVYEGSTVLEVPDGTPVTAQVLLTRNLENCPLSASDEGAGTIEIDGALVTVLGADFEHFALGTDGVLTMAANDYDARLIRYDLTTSTVITELATPWILDLAVADAGGPIYIASGNSIYQIDPTTPQALLFAIAPTTVQKVFVIDDLVFAINKIDGHGHKSLYHRPTGARLANVGGDAAESLAWAPGLGRMFMLVSEWQDELIYVDIDTDARSLNVEVEWPYFDEYENDAPIKVFPDESNVVLGSGNIFHTDDLSYTANMGHTFDDLQFDGSTIYLAKTLGDKTKVSAVNWAFDSLGSREFEGKALALFVYDGDLILLTDSSYNQTALYRFSPEILAD